MALIQTVHLSMANFKSAPVVPAVQNDTDRQIKMVIDDFDLTAGLTGKITFVRSDGTHYEASATLDVATNSFTADIDQALTQPGRTMVQLKVTDTLTVSTFSFVIFVEEDTSGTVTPQEGIDLVTAVEAAEDAADRAEEAVRTLDGYVTEEEMSAAISANVDSTLSVSGKAADAKAVGDEIGELKSAIDKITTIGAQLFDKNHAEVVHLLPANGTVSASVDSTSVIIPVNPSASDTYITVRRDTISSRFTVATFTEKPAIGSTPVTLTGNNSASAITVACDTTITYIMVLVHNASYDTGVTVQTMLDGLMVEFGASYTGYEPYTFGVIIPDKSVNGDSFSNDGVEFITELVNELTEGEKAFTDSNRTDVMTVSDVSLTWTDGSYYDLTTGDIIPLSGRSYSQKINCKYGDRISITNNKGQILFWKENDALLSYVATSQNSTLTVVVPDSAVKYAFNNFDSTIRGTTATKYVNANPLIESECTAPAKLVYGSESFISGKYCSTSNGKISTVATFYCLPFIPVKSNHKYRTQTQTQVAFYDSSLGFISALLPGNDANNTGTTVEMDFTTPATCKFISVNSKSAHEMLFDLDYMIAGYIDNPQKLQGKTVVCFGDSITGNYGFGDNYPSRIEEFTGAKTYNCGFGGCRMELVPSDSDVAYTNPFSMCGIVDALEADKNGDATAWDDMDDNALTLSRMVYFRLQILKAIDWSKVDIVTIAYGTNEGGYPQDDENNKYNKQTYAGATRYCIEKLLTLYPTLRIVLLTPIYRYYTSEGQDSDSHVNPNYGNKLTDNVATLISVGHEYKIPVIDLYYTLGINIENYTSYFGDEDEQSDGTHINSFGREQMGRRVAGELMRLV